MKQALFLLLTLCSCSPGLDGLVKQLAHSDANIRVYAAEKLGESGNPDAVMPLIGALRDEKAVVRLAVIDALGRFQDVRAVKPLLPLLKDRYSSVILATMDVLGQIGNVEAVDSLRVFVENDVSTLRLGAMDALGLIGDSTAVDVLCNQVWDRSVEVRWVAAIALGNIGHFKAMGTLMELLADLNDHVYQTALFALNQIDPNWRQSQEARLAIRRFIRDLKPKDITGDDQAIVCQGAVQGLNAVDQNWRQYGWADEVMAHYMVRLKDEDATVRRAATQALGRVGDGRVIEALSACLSDSIRQVRQGAVWALQYIRDARAIPVLRKILDGENIELKGAAMVALSELGDTSSVSLIMRQVNPNVMNLRSGKPGWEIPASAALALGQLNAIQGVDMVIQILGHEHVMMRCAAAKALGQIGDLRVVEPLVKVLHDQSEQVRDVAIHSLGQLGDVRVVNMLIDQLGTGKVDDKHLVVALDRLDMTWRDCEAAKGRTAALIQNFERLKGVERQWAAVVLSLLGGDEVDAVFDRLLRQRDLPILSVAFRYYIRNGGSEAVPVLVRALESYGDENMMKGLLASGHPALMKAARKWAYAHGMALVSRSIEEEATWGGIMAWLIFVE
jgi:HEAT repeat protein